MRLDAYTPFILDILMIEHLKPITYASRLVEKDGQIKIKS